MGFVLFIIFGYGITCAVYCGNLVFEREKKLRYML